MLKPTLINYTLIRINDPNQLAPYTGISPYLIRHLNGTKYTETCIITVLTAYFNLLSLLQLSPYCNRLSYNIPYVACPRCISNENRVEDGTQMIGGYICHSPTKRAPIINIYIFVFSRIQLNMYHLKQVV